MSIAVELRAVARLDFAEVLRSRWIWFCVAAYLVLGGVLLTVGVRESQIMGFTGTSRMLLSFAHALILLLPLLALMALAPAVQRARDDGSLELLFSQPLSPAAWFLAVCGVRYLALVVPLALVMAALAAWGQLVHGDPVPWAFLGRSLAVSAALLLAFTGIGAAISVFVRSPARVITYLVLTWALSVALLDFALIGLMLRWRLDAHAVFVLAVANPVEAARLALLSSLQPELAAFGPVGFYLANRIGSGALFALGVAWPALLGLCAWGVAYLGFRRSDRI
ncbi:MAG TPA: ABC transporter permease subunit [Kofleriaceae bacterium]|nr:ABC transporter permease subunit [Kofleriaceae bacterium]